MDPRSYTSYSNSEQPSPAHNVPQSYTDLTSYSYVPSYTYQKESIPTYNPVSYTTDPYSYRSTYEAPKSATLPQATSLLQSYEVRPDLTSYLTYSNIIKPNNVTSTIGSASPGGRSGIKKNLRALEDAKDQIKQQQAMIKSTALTFFGEMQRNMKALQNELADINRHKGVEVGRMRHEKDEIEFHRDTLREDTEKLTKKNEELRISAEQAIRNLERREKDHAADLEKFKQLYDEMIRNISEEKKRAINKLSAELKQKEAELQSIGQQRGEIGGATVVTRHAEGEKVKNTRRNVEEVSGGNQEIVRLKEILQSKEEDLKAERELRAEKEKFWNTQNTLMKDMEKELLQLRLRKRSGEESLDYQSFRQQEEERTKRYEERIKELEERLTKSGKQEEVTVSKGDTEELTKLRETIAELEERLKSKESESKEAEGERVQGAEGAGEEQLVRQKSKKKEYKKKLSAAQEEVAKEQKEKEAIALRLQELEKEVEKWSLVDEDRKRILEQANEAVETEKKQREEMITKLSEMEGKIASVKGKKKGYKSQLSMANEKVVSEEQEKGELAEKKREYEEELQKQNARLEEYQKIIRETEEVAKLERSTKEELGAKIASLEELVGKYKDKKKGYKTRLGEARSDMGRDNEGLMKELSDVREKNEHLVHTVKNLEENVQKLENVVENYKNIEENYKNTLSLVKAEAEEAKKKNEEIAAKEAELAEKVKKQGEKKKNYKKQLSDVQGEAMSAQQEKEKLTGRMSELESQLEKLKETQGTYESELDIARKKVEEESKHKVEILSSKEEFEKEIGELREKFTRAEEHERNLLKKISDFERKMKESETLTAKYKEIEEKCSQVERELAKVREESEAKGAELEKWKQEAQQKGGHLEQSKSKTENAEKTLEKLNKELEGEREQKKKLEDKIKGLEKDLGAAKEEGKQAKKIGQVEAEKKKLEESLKGVTNEKSQLEEKYKKELENVKKELEVANKKVEEAEKAKKAEEEKNNGFVSREREVVVEKGRQTEAEGARMSRAGEKATGKKKPEADQEKEELKKMYGQKIQEMENELASKEQHINALKYDVEQMKEWIVVRHGDEVFEQESLEVHPNKHISNDEKYEILESADVPHEETATRMVQSVPGKSPLDLSGKNQEKSGSDKKKKKNQPKNLSLNWKGKVDENSSSVSMQKKDPLSVSTSEIKHHGGGGDLTPRSIRTTESVRTPESRRGGKGRDREREGGPAYAQLEKMILELNEKLSNADKKAKHEWEKRVHDINLEHQTREERLREEIEKLKEEKKVVDAKLNDIEWKHAYELNNLLQKEKAEKEALMAKQAGEATTQSQGKKKKKKGSNTNV